MDSIDGLWSTVLDNVAGENADADLFPRRTAIAVRNPIKSGGRYQMGMEVRVERTNKDKLPKIADGAVNIGWFADMKYDDQTPVAKVAAILEYGSPWAFMRPTVHQKQGQWRNTVKTLMKAAIKNGISSETVLKQMGEIAKGDIQGTIAGMISPPNAPATIKRKGFNKPLVDTGVMLASIQSRLEGEK